MKTKGTVYSIVGARPQFIKLAPLARVLSKKLRHVIVHTGQHYDHNMSGVFFRQLGIPKANVNLNIGGVTHGAMTGRMLEELEALFLQRRPDAVVVYGDTNSTLAGALAASKLSIPVAHVESGLRSFVPDMPEEINRRVTDQLAQLLFCPTETAIRNLRREGIKEGVVRSGDLMYELLHDSGNVIRGNTRFLKAQGLEQDQFGLLTFHRACNTDSRENLIRLCEILDDAKLPILFPLHPRTRKSLQKNRLLSRLKKNKQLMICDPLGYRDLLTAACFARFVMTDSGGLQKEALFLGTPVLTLRNETEWVELLKKGNRLVSLDKAKVLAAWKRPGKVSVIDHRIGRKRPSQIIASSLVTYLKGV
ncbi:MAG: UDP-N-acetylglucosamine 2-epimerase (non-hydrolyzing) [bacterium]|nr:UDP-N-acetylglucosamine 2-epimerase (non-hydrolyzing) [bacterium]